MLWLSRVVSTLWILVIYNIVTDIRYVSSKSTKKDVRELLYNMHQSLKIFIRAHTNPSFLKELSRAKLKITVGTKRTLFVVKILRTNAVSSK
jgi:hypothetical protein